MVLPDGSTPVNIGQSLSAAQLNGLRFKSTTPNASSEISWNIGLPGGPTVPISLKVTYGPVIAGASCRSAHDPRLPPLPLPPPMPRRRPQTRTLSSLENQKPGAPPSSWQIAPGQDSKQIEGFKTSISTPLGGTVQFKINNQTGNGNYQINIYRLGYYGGDGATLVTTINHRRPLPLFSLLVTSTTGATDAGGLECYRLLAVPANATSGVYIANVIGLADIPHPVRHHQPQLGQQYRLLDLGRDLAAYNGFGGANLYGGNDPSMERGLVCSQL